MNSPSMDIIYITLVVYQIIINKESWVLEKPLSKFNKGKLISFFGFEDGNGHVVVDH